MYYDNIYGSSYFQLCSLAYILLLAFSFYTRRKLNTVENKVYSLLILTNIIGVILDVASVYIAYFDPENFLLIPLAKLYLTYLVGFLMICLLYFAAIINVTYTSEQKLNLFNRLKSWFLSTFLIICTLILCLPLYFHTENGIMYSYGPSAIFTYICSFILLVAMIILVITKRKTTNKTKIIPIVALIIIGGTAAIIQFLVPDLLIVTSACVLCTVVLYLTVFTVENPDLKLIEEIEANRIEADRANKSKTEFLANMSHEIRTPLNAILGFSQGLLDEDLDDAAKEDAEDIVNASDSLLSIVNEILDISKIEADKLEIENSEYSFSKIYRYLVTMTQGRLGEKPLEFIHECDKNIPEVLYGDSVRIKQIVVNLLTNSIKYTQQGFVKLAINCEILDAENCKLTILVEDSGIGIKEEDLKKLFVKFERLDTEKNINVEGTGLGLTLTKRLVELMGGEIKVESKYGLGSKFTVILNQKIIKKENKVPEQPQKNIISSPDNIISSTNRFVGHGEKILIVDDNNVNLKVASRLLQQYNLQIETSNSGKDFIKKVTSGNKYDLVLLDDMMPEMSGVETLNYIKKNMDYRVPTIALTANAISGMKEEYLKDGFTDYLSKPIEKSLLEEILIKYLSNKSTQNNNLNKQSVQDKTNNYSDNSTKKENLEIV